MTRQKNSYLKIFITAFISFMIITIPVVIYNKGYMTYYGDFNSQQLPFLQHMYESIRNGNILWDWNTDLGSDFISTYSYYLLGSPFFWIMLTLPQKLVLYSVPWILSLKYAVAALTSYAYIKRFTKIDSSAFIGGMLYAFSGFQAYNIFFNQFHDPTAFFPLILLAMEEHITRGRRGIFAVTVALSALTSYFFFAGQAVFLIIYFIIRSQSKDFKITPAKFFTLLLEAILGTAAAAFILFPAALSVLENQRLSNHLYGMDLLAYSDRTRIWRIIQGFFMIPDSPARPNLFSDGTSKWSSIAGYLPLFSMIGVISYLKAKPDTWKSRLIKICIVFAFIPVLNSVFFMLNSEYYARWFYMPILIMALITAQVFERSDIDTRPGIRVCGIFMFAALIISFLPSKTEDGEVVWMGFADHKAYFYITLGISFVFLLIAASILKRKKNGKEYLKKGICCTTAACFISTAATFYFGIYEGPYPEQFIASSINDKSAEILNDDTDFFRTDISENCDNYAMFWGYPSMRSFHSTVSPSIMEFYNSVGIRRDVASRADTSFYALRGLFSVKYYFSRKDINGTEIKTPDMPGFEKISDGDNFAVYKNKYYIPMGFTYDSYISEEEFNKLSDQNKTNVLMRALLLSDEQIKKYGNIFDDPEPIDSKSLTQESYIDDCINRIFSSCYEFSKSTGGFRAKISTNKESMVFFSIPYDKGFTAFVNGEETEILKVNNGFMAVVVPEGDNSIIFSYTTYGLLTGIRISAAAFLIILMYILIYLIYKNINSKKAKTLQLSSEEIQPDDRTAAIKIVEGSVIDINITEVK